MGEPERKRRGPIGWLIAMSRESMATNFRLRNCSDSPVRILGQVFAVSCGFAIVIVIAATVLPVIFAIVFFIVTMLKIDN